MFLKVLSLSFLLLICQISVGSDEQELHDRLLVLDSHIDTPIRLVMPGFNIMERHDASTDYSQVDLPRMVDGGLDGGFWAIFTSQGDLSTDGYAKAKRIAHSRANAILQLEVDHPDYFTVAKNAADAKIIVGKGRKVVYLSIENAYPLGLDVSNLREFYDLGVRMLGLVHTRNNQFADSSTDPSGPKWDGLSPLGIELVQEANKLGMIIDGSHAHDLALEQMISYSSTPVVLSHSGSKAIFDHPRNVPDDLLIKLKQSGGLIHINSLGGYLQPIHVSSGRKMEFGKFVADINILEAAGNPMSYEEFRTRRGDIDRTHPREEAHFFDYMSHFTHVLDLLGPSYVGVGADWDGGGGVIGMKDISDLRKVTEHLLHSGYTEADLENVWGDNLLRLLRKVERRKIDLGSSRFLIDK